MNEELIQTSFPETQTHDLKSRVQANVKQSIRRRKLIRRSVWGAVGTACAVGIFTVLPVARGMATLLQMGGALDDVEAFRSVSYSLLENGTPVKTGEIAYDKGKWRLQSPGRELMVYNGGALYLYDDWLKVFVREQKPDGPFAYNAKGIGLENLLGPSGFRFLSLVSDSKVKLDGKSVRRVEVKNNNLPEWSVYFADAETDLPIRVEYHSMLDGRKQMRGFAEYEYSEPNPDVFLEPYRGPIPPQIVTIPFSEPNTIRLIGARQDLESKVAALGWDDPETVLARQKVKSLSKLALDTPNVSFVSDNGRVSAVLDKKDWEAERARKLTARTTAQVRVGETDVVVHDLQVEPDGTIWVTFQAGARFAGWRGHALDIRSNRKYIHGQELMGGPGVWVGKPRTRLEYEFFVPVEPGAATDSFELMVSASATGKVLRSGSGTETAKVKSLGPMDPAKFAGKVPGYIKYDVGNFMNPIQVEIRKAQSLSGYWDGQADRAKALDAHRRVLNLMQEHNRLGYGPWNEESERNAIRRLGG